MRVSRGPVFIKSVPADGRPLRAVLPCNARMGSGQAHSMLIETRAVAPFFKNGYVLGCEGTREGVLIDPGDEVAELLSSIERNRLSIKYILLTHAHLDHVSGVGRASKA